MNTKVQNETDQKQELGIELHSGYPQQGQGDVRLALLLLLLLHPGEVNGKHISQYSNMCSDIGANVASNGLTPNVALAYSTYVANYNYRENNM